MTTRQRAPTSPTSKLEVVMGKCKKCGSTHMKVTMWDGARSGGSRLECMACGFKEEHGVKQVTYKGHSIILRW